jgi:thiol:disulfide interchange protein
MSQNTLILMAKAALLLVCFTAVWKLFTYRRHYGQFIPASHPARPRAILSIVAFLLAIPAYMILNSMGGVARLQAQVGSPVPAIALNQVADDVAINLAAYKGQPVLVNYWATW